MFLIESTKPALLFRPFRNPVSLLVEAAAKFDEVRIQLGSAQTGNWNLFILANRKSPSGPQKPLSLSISCKG
jgi:hypothetical protein